MRQVTRDEFFARINADRLDVHPRITNDKWPYTSDWHFHSHPGRPLYGRTVDLGDGGTTYFLAS